jgi:phosphoenolpyruvate carboxylase
MTFTKPEQTKHRKAFIDNCRQKAWGAACHADWLAGITSHYEKRQAEDCALEEAIKAAELAVDYHTVENRNKRKAMQERRNTLAQQMKVISENAQGQRSLQQLYASVESNLELAKHADEWEWKEVVSETKNVRVDSDA